MSSNKKNRKPAKKTRAVTVITGSRADYSILRPVIQAIDNSVRLELRLAVTNMHWDKAFGENQKPEKVADMGRSVTKEIAYSRNNHE